jgi:hypothetical protein
MADPLDRILCTLEKPPSYIEKYCALYGNVKMLRSYNKIHSDLVRYAVKGEQFAILKFLLTQESQFYDAEIVDAIRYSFRYNKVSVLNFIKTLMSGSIAGYSCLGNWLNDRQQTRDDFDNHYIFKHDSIDCFIWNRINMMDYIDTYTDIYELMQFDSITILEYIYSINPDTIPNISVSSLMESDSVRILQFMYSITPFQITRDDIAHAIRRGSIRTLRWFNTITDMSDYVLACAQDNYGNNAYEILTDEQLISCLEKMIEKQHIRYIQHCVSKNLLSEKMFISCFKKRTGAHMWISIFDNFVEHNALTEATLIQLRNHAVNTNYALLLDRVDRYDRYDHTL